MLKVSGLIGTKPLLPITTLTGIVTLLPPEDWNTTWPVKVPATSPLPGKAELTTFTVAVEGADPLAGLTVSQWPPSDVLDVAVQCRIPHPAGWIFTVWAGGLVVLGVKEKSIWPGTLAKNGPHEATVKVTGTVMDKLFEGYSFNTIWPV
jgi:hypothetical protein